MATVQLLCGAARSERARHADGLMRKHWGRARLLVPAREYARRAVAGQADDIEAKSPLSTAWTAALATAS